MEFSKIKKRSTIKFTTLHMPLAHTRIKRVLIVGEEMPTPTLRCDVSGKTNIGVRMLVFVHGWPDDERCFTLQTSHFEKTCRVVTMCPPWHGCIAYAEAEETRVGHLRDGYTLEELADGLA